MASSPSGQGRRPLFTLGRSSFFSTLQGFCLRYDFAAAYSGGFVKGTNLKESA
jgi:hypothetical protein